MTTVSTISDVKTSKPVTIQPTQIEPGNPPSKHQQTQDASPTQVTVRILEETPTQIPVLAIQPVPPPRIPSDTENKAPYPVSNLPYPTDSLHEIPIAGKF